MSNQTDHTIVRLRVPPELKKLIEESAEQNNRSQSAEMVARLEQSFEPRSVIQAEDPDALKSIVAYGIKTVLDELRNEGVQDEAISKALTNVAKK
ncbi:Arc family DNA-binding protein [Acinetobacter haemolyticus]|uniref:Arc family DNA-binding protein n=1 Tax=Acinetobacter haemolyticus TaxID=29430 RepID=UPI00129875E6|nr:Arc family DNA-binding protein [Acinetobacter haemolyticus]MQZ31938.1 Arc family DNA-binding protein [Acinetobacter haemolyticus]